MKLPWWQTYGLRQDPFQVWSMILVHDMPPRGGRLITSLTASY